MTTSFHLDPRCEISVVIPVRNEERYIARCIERFAAQRDVNGRFLDKHIFELHILVNNSNDDTLCILERLRVAYPTLGIHISVRNFPREQANVGTARHWLFEHAAQRFSSANRHGIIATTDADTMISETWIAATIAAFRKGADAVTGFISIDPDEFAALPTHVQAIIHADRRYRMMLEALATRLDPSDPEPWPRHYHHTGASLALTTGMYQQCGGMPRVATHEDIALVRALRRIDATLLHRFDVSVSTSARCQARAYNGMGDRLMEWSAQGRSSEALLVRHPEDDIARLRARAALRVAWTKAMHGDSLHTASDYPVEIAAMLDARLPFGHIWNMYYAWLRHHARSHMQSVSIAYAIDFLHQILSSDSCYDGVRSRLA